MLPFTGYNMSDYFQHWLNLGEKLASSATSLDKATWLKELELHGALFKQPEPMLPQELLVIKRPIEQRPAA